MNDNITLCFPAPNMGCGSTFVQPSEGITA